MDEALQRALSEIVGAEGLVADRRQLRLYRGGLWGPTDVRRRFGETPMLAVRPTDASQVAACLHLICAAGYPAIALGGGTGLTGGQLPTAETVVVDLARLDHTYEIDPASRRARVDAGVRLGALAAAAEERGLLFAHDPWSQALASVGGAIATNGVGYLAAGYGAMGAQVLGLEVALTTGELLDLPTAPTSSAGPDLNRLFVGSEGTLGVITAATVRLFPQPERRIFAGYRFASFEDGFGALQDAVGLRLPLALVDYEEDDEGPTSTLFTAVDAIRSAAEAVAGRMEEIARAHGAERLPDGEVEHFWHTRHASADRYAQQIAEHRIRLLASEEEPPPARRSGGWRYIHLGLPAGAVLAFREHARVRAKARRVHLRSAGIWAVPELFSFVLDGPARATDALADELLRDAAELGGSIEYCHGVGLRLAHLMESCLGPAMPVLRRVKGALDPSGLLNPGKQGLGSV